MCSGQCSMQPPVVAMWTKRAPAAVRKFSIKCKGLLSNEKPTLKFNSSFPSCRIYQIQKDYQMVLHYPQDEIKKSNINTSWKIDWSAYLRPFVTKQGFVRNHWYQLASNDHHMRMWCWMKFEGHWDRAAQKRLRLKVVASLEMRWSLG